MQEWKAVGRGAWNEAWRTVWGSTEVVPAQVPYSDRKESDLAGGVKSGGTPFRGKTDSRRFELGVKIHKDSFRCRRHWGGRETSKQEGGVEI